MENEKQQLNATLLSVRAGLSAISKICDDIKEEENKVNTLKQKILQNDQDCKNATNIIITTDRESRVLNNNRLRCESKRYEIEHREIKKSYIKGVIAPLIILGCIILISILFIIEAHILKEYSSSYGLASASLFLAVPILIGILIGQGVDVKKELSNEKNKKEQDLNAILNEISTIEKEIREKSVKIKTYQEQLMRYNKQKKDTERELETVGEEVANKIIEYKATANAIALGLTQNYGNVITESDWQNLDLIIHYLNTGRADSIKEALYQVDRQRQNDALVSAIKASSDAICSHIRTSTQILATQLNNGFIALKNSITSSISSYIENNNAQSEKLATMLNEQLESRKMTNALLEKANETSLNLYEHYKYINRA